jgi:hypothetical protein
MQGGQLNTHAVPRHRSDGGRGVLNGVLNQEFDYIGQQVLFAISPVLGANQSLPYSLINFVIPKACE